MNAQDIESIIRQHLAVKSIAWSKFADRGRAVIVVETVDGHPGIHIAHEFHAGDDEARVLDLVKNTLMPSVQRHLEAIKAQRS